MVAIAQGSSCGKKRLDFRVGTRSRCIFRFHRFRLLPTGLNIISTGLDHFPLLIGSVSFSLKEKPLDAGEVTTHDNFLEEGFAGIGKLLELAAAAAAGFQANRRYLRSGRLRTSLTLA